MICHGGLIFFVGVGSGKVEIELVGMGLGQEITLAFAVVVGWPDQIAPADTVAIQVLVKASPGARGPQSKSNSFSRISRTHFNLARGIRCDKALPKTLCG